MTGNELLRAFGNIRDEDLEAADAKAGRPRGRLAPKLCAAAALVLAAGGIFLAVKLGGKRPDGRTAYAPPPVNSSEPAYHAGDGRKDGPQYRPGEATGLPVPLPSGGELPDKTQNATNGPEPTLPSTVPDPPPYGSTTAEPYMPTPAGEPAETPGPAFPTPDETPGTTLDPYMTGEPAVPTNEPYYMELHSEEELRRLILEGGPAGLDRYYVPEHAAGEPELIIVSDNEVYFRYTGGVMTSFTWLFGVDPSQYISDFLRYFPGHYEEHEGYYAYIGPNETDVTVLWVQDGQVFLAGFPRNSPWGAPGGGSWSWEETEYICTARRVNV